MGMLMVPPPWPPLRERLSLRVSQLLEFLQQQWVSLPLAVRVLSVGVLVLVVLLVVAGLVLGLRALVQQMALSAETQQAAAETAAGQGQKPA